MENFLKYLWGFISGAVALLLPVRPLVLCAVVFVAVDFVVGVVASWSRARRSRTAWAFESRKAWNTVYKLFFVMAGICLAWLIDSLIIDFATLNLAKVFTGFVCGVEFWSYLENAAEISDHPMFRALRRILKSRVDQALMTTDEPRTEK